MTTDVLVVLLGARPIGEVTRTRAGLTFSYDDAYRNGPRATPPVDVDPTGGV